MIGIAPLCFYCKHEFANKPGPVYETTPQCDAFPNRIPDAIYHLDHDHRKPYPGDNGICFEPIEKDSPFAYKLETLPNFLKHLEEISKW
jgi:hypothetical protein